MDASNRPSTPGSDGEPRAERISGAAGAADHDNAHGYDDPDATTYPARGRRLWSSRNLLTSVVLLLIAIGAITFWMWRSTDEPPQLLTARQGAGAAIFADEVHVVGGISSDGTLLGTAEALDVSSSNWRTLPPLLQAVHHPAVAALGDQLFVFGGYTSIGATSTTGAVQIFDSETGEWHLGTPMPAPLGGAAAVADGERIYVIGGDSGTAAVSDVRAYDPVTDEWESLTPMPTARTRHGAAMLGNVVHVVGGLAGSGGAAGASALGTHEAFDPQGGSWTSLAPLPSPRAEVAVAALDACLVVFGGVDAGGSLAAGSTVSYEPAADSWRPVEAGISPRRGSSAIALPSGDLLLIGGSETARGPAASTVTRLQAPRCASG